MTRFIKAILTVLTVLSTIGCNESQITKPDSNPFIQSGVKRAWLGPAFWANRLQDWQLNEGRIECIEKRASRPYRTAHLLTKQLADKDGDFELAVTLGLINTDNVTDSAAAGFLIGAGPGLDYRAASLIHHSSGPGAGILALVDASGAITFRDMEMKNYPVIAKVNGNYRLTSNPYTLSVTARQEGDNYILNLTVSSTQKGRAGAYQTPANSSKSITIPAKRLAGNIAIVSHPGKPEKGKQTGTFWFNNISVDGSKIATYDGKTNDNRTCGPIICTQYTLSNNILKLTAQMMPLGENDNQQVELWTTKKDHWEKIATTTINPEGYIAPFTVKNWDSTKDVRYRVVYRLKRNNGVETPHYWTGTIKHDPVEKETLTIAGFTGNHNLVKPSKKGAGGADSGYCLWSTHIAFPHNDIISNVPKHNPDLYFFSGDQVYEGFSPTGVDKKNLHKDLLYKWYLWCWAFGDMVRSTPCICIPDDHDVYQGNLWGEYGRKTDKDDKGGYVNPAEWVNMSQRVQTSHLPETPFPGGKVDQNIDVYYCPMTYGRIGFAILEDRKFKSGCNGRVPKSDIRPDHLNDPNIDPKTLDVPGVKLLGDEQLDFIREWAQDWNNQDMKVALSQTIFAGMATHHGESLTRLLCDLDSNGWPQTGRNKALTELRKGFVFMLAGDQHLASLVHHGVEEFNDSGWSMCVPSICNFYPRAWMPETEGNNRGNLPPHLGEHEDGFKNKVNVFAVTNPVGKGGKPTGIEPADLQDKMPGYGIVKMNKKTREITIECWPRYVNPKNSATGKQYAGWPKTIDQFDNYARKAVAWLPTIKVKGPDNPVIQIVNERTGQVQYTVRINGNTFRPKIFEDTPHTIKIGYPEIDNIKIVNHIASTNNKTKTLNLEFLIK